MKTTLKKPGSITLVIAGIIISVAVYFSLNRYYIIPGAKGIGYEVDRITGKTWVLDHGEKNLQKGEGQTKVDPVTDLPPWEISKLTGNAAFDPNIPYFSGSIYNGTDWHILEITATITAKNQDGSVRWMRQYKLALGSDPLSSEDFAVKVSDTTGASASWQIDSARGFP